VPHYPKPFFRKSRGLWYVQVASRQVNLGPDRDEAFRRYHELMARPTQAGPEPAAEDRHVETYAVRFLLWCKERRSAETVTWYGERIRSFLAHAGDVTVDELKPYMLHEWCDAHTSWSDGMKRGAITAVQRCLNWAVKVGHLERNPVAYVEKPEAGRRDRYVTPAEFQAILSNVKDDAFRDLLVVSYETGCRPQESLIVTAANIDLANARWVFERENSKGKKRQRVVYLTEAAQEICERRMRRFGEGPIFRNRRGRPWTPYAVNCRFNRLADKVGFKPCLYLLRHAWMTRLLQNGVDPITVSTLAGHVDTSMLSRVYAHLNHSPDHLRRSVERLKREPAP
jgi:integrase